MKSSEVEEYKVNEQKQSYFFYTLKCAIVPKLYIYIYYIYIYISTVVTKMEKLRHE